MIRRGTEWALRLLLVGVAILGPSFMAFQLVSAAGNPGGQLRGGIVSKTLQLAQNNRLATPGPVVDPPPITAILYTNGSANVSWNDRVFVVENGSYAYVGGERVEVAPGSMGLLQLSDGSNVFACAGSSVSLARSDSGAYVLAVTRGSARFSFAAGTDFRVRASDTLITAGDSVTQADGPFEGEVQSRADGGGLICELAQSLKVIGAGQNAASATPAALSGNGAASPAPVSGRVIEVGSSGAVTATPIPAAAMPASLSAGASPGTAFLCQCEALKKRVEDLLATQQAESQQDTASTPSEEVVAEVASPQGVTSDTPVAESSPEAVQSAEEASQQSDQPPSAEAPVAPPVAPPDAPPVALAEPSSPDPFDPNILPPPAAGEPSNPVVFVAPPAVPTSGSGGGGVASPS
ncbi:MAG: hypothetical protein ACI9DC_004042 [Gammaproteobacteria bacterium]|jgi:hypothetical protein